MLIQKLDMLEIDFNVENDAKISKIWVEKYKKVFKVKCRNQAVSVQGESSGSEGGGKEHVGSKQGIGCQSRSLKKG